MCLCSKRIIRFLNLQMIKIAGILIQSSYSQKSKMSPSDLKAGVEFNIKRIWQSTQREEDEANMKGNVFNSWNKNKNNGF